MIRNKLIHVCSESSSKVTAIARAADEFTLKRGLSNLAQHNYDVRPDTAEAVHLTTMLKCYQNMWSASGTIGNNMNVTAGIHSCVYGSASSRTPSILVSLPLAFNTRTSSSLGTGSKKKERSFIPRKAPVKLTSQARKFFKLLIEQKLKQEEQLKVDNDNADNDSSLSSCVGIMLKYQQSLSGEPRMVYTFDYVTQDQISNQDEPVSLEIIETTSTGNDSNQEDEEIPKPPEESINDGLPKLYIHQHAFLKVLGSTIDLDTKTFAPILYDKEGNELDPNA